jgi:hypothetical protein
MTPKEKADKLCMRFLMHTHTEDCEYDIDKNLAKQCALIAVDEIIDEVKTILDDEIYSSVLIYWLKVKQEIEKL